MPQLITHPSKPTLWPVQTVHLSDNVRVVKWSGVVELSKLQLAESVVTITGV